MDKPLVSVICLCYNHEQFVQKAIDSVLDQTYHNIELIVIDDASNDDSQQIIEEASKNHEFRIIFNDTNIGNCRSFNSGFKLSKGKYLIDLAADDFLLPERIALGVEQLQQKGESYGVHFCDVNLLKNNGQSLGTHYKRDLSGKLLEQVPSGNIYIQLVEKYLVCTPSMMMSRKVLEKLNGYDEQLTYEDFDFWVRSARDYKYTYSDKVLVEKTISDTSLSASQYDKKNIHALSTAKVCNKILKMNKSQQENEALLKRITYELKWALITENWEASKLFIQIKDKISANTVRSRLEKIILKLRPPWFAVLKLLLKFSY